MIWFGCCGLLVVVVVVGGLFDCGYLVVLGLFCLLGLGFGVVVC